MESQNLSNDLVKIQKRTSQLFNELIADNTVFNFLKQVSEDKSKDTNEILKDLIETWEVDVLPIVEFRNEDSGNVYNAHICVISNENIMVLGEKSNKCFSVKFEDLASLEDKLILLNEMEEYLVESN